MEEEIPTFIVELGTASWKGGFSGEKEPTITVFGGAAPDPADATKLIVGDAAADLNPNVIVHPLKQGKIDWTCKRELEALFKHLFDAKHVHADKTPVCVVIPLGFTDAEREHLSLFLFETFHFQSVLLLSSAVMAASVNGLDTALVIDMGDDSTRISPVVDLKELAGLCVVLPVGGKLLTAELGRLLKEQGNNLGAAASKFLKQIKEKHLAIAQDGKYEVAAEEKEEVVKVTVPEHPTEISLTDSARFKPAEVFFDPPKDLKEAKSLVTTILDVVGKLEDKNRTVLLRSIVLAGGSSFIPGFKKRLMQELSNALGGKQHVIVSDLVKGPDQRYSSWTGASVLIALDHPLVKHSLIHKK